ncbi:MAG: hypothetical protein P1U67_14015 [Alcanivoracaceae bacterium]|nr:hypothetical protein [Alcanivoracaceae bacterium]
MSISVFHSHNIDVRHTDVRETDVTFSLSPSMLFGQLPSLETFRKPLQFLSGVLMAVLADHLVASLGGDEPNVVPMLLAGFAAVTFAVALDVNRTWWLGVAAMQLALLLPAGYLLSSGAFTVADLIGLHIALITVLLLDYRALNFSVTRVWLGAEIGLLLAHLL